MSQKYKVIFLCNNNHKLLARTKKTGNLLVYKAKQDTCVILFMQDLYRFRLFVVVLLCFVLVVVFVGLRGVIAWQQGTRMRD